MLTERGIAATILILSSGAVCAFVSWWMISCLDALLDIHRELVDMNRLTRERWHSDYLEGRIEKPVKVRS